MKQFQIGRVLDGGMGREIKKRGHPFQQPQWSAFIIESKPEVLIEIHSDFIKEGAEIITTNTYAIVPFHISQEKFKNKGQDMIRTACEMALKARQMHPDKKVQIACSVPPIFGSYRPDLFLQDRAQAEELYQFFLAPTFELDYIDLYQCQTLSSIQQASMLMRLLQKTSKPYCLSFTIDDESAELRDKDSKLTELASVIYKFEKKPIAVMINCARPQAISRALPALRQSLPNEIKVGCYPNNFQVRKRDNYDPKKDAFIVRDDLEVSQFGKMAEQWIKMGAEIVGGCCGIGPEYIPAIVSAFNTSKPE